MITLNEAFAKFKSRLELNPNEQKDVSRRHYEVRDIVNEKFNIDRDFLTGSYARYTKTKPLKDVDIFCVLNSEKENHYLKKSPINLLEDFRKALAPIYGESNVSIGRRSVRIGFGIKENESDDKVMSIDVVPAFALKDAYQIPDPYTSANWTKTNPEIHAERATAANKAFSEEWKPLVKMIKKWNNTQDKPIQPSFLVEVMALEILYPPFSGGYVYELKSFFSTAAERIYETWNDPSGLGPPVSDEMTEVQRKTATNKFSEAGKYVDCAIQLSRQGKNGEALKVWREKIFGEMFPLS
ncbi:MAG: nucleotidyltransferase [Candidatus Jettenia sp.]|nr:nucleotidyltransferase [Candidatus Jettenia sp.]